MSQTRAFSSIGYKTKFICLCIHLKKCPVIIRLGEAYTCQEHPTDE